MNNRCGYCGGAYELDRCPNCDHVRGQLPKPFITYGPGYMGDYRTLEEAQALIEHNRNIGPAALYIRVDVAVEWGMNAAKVEVV